MKQEDVLKPDDPLGSSVLPRRSRNWSAIVTVIFLVAGGLAYAGYQLLAPTGPAANLPEAGAGPEAPGAPEEGEAAATAVEEVPSEVPTAREAAFAWRDASLAGSPFADLPVKETGDGLYLVYEARSGDSIPAVVGRYSEAAGLKPELEPELVAEVTDRHREAFERALWAGDELLLPVPEELLTPQPAPQLEAADEESTAR